MSYLVNTTLLPKYYNTLFLSFHSLLSLYPVSLTIPPEILEAIARPLDRCTVLTGRAAAWLTVAIVLATAAVVVLRYGFNIGFVALQELITYLHGAIFMLGAAFTLQQGRHVRVDIFYRRLPKRRRMQVNIAGHLLFLVPICLTVLFTSLDYVLVSWRIREVSTEPAGLPAIFLLKTLIPLFALTLLAQGLAETLRLVALLSRGETRAGREP